MIIHLTDNCIVVEVDKYTTKLEVSNRQLVDSWADEEWMPYATLPPGQWQFLSLLSDMDEGKAEEIVEEVVPFGRIKRYQDYEFFDSAFYTALESFHILIQLKGIDTNKQYAVLIKK